MKTDHKFKNHFINNETYKISEKNLYNDFIKVNVTEKFNDLHPGEVTKLTKPWKTNCGAWCLVSVFLISLFGCTTMWSTNLFQDLVEKSLVLRNDTFRFEMWKKPPAVAHLNVYIFNYTRILEYGEKKFKVEEIGPFTYREIVEKVNIKINDNGTISYQEKKTYEFIPERSVGDLSSMVTVPNVPMMGAVSLVKDGSFLQRLGMSTILGTLHSKPFIHTSVQGLLWGYEDNLFKLARNVIAFKEEVPFVNFGLMAGKNDTPGPMNTIYSGVVDSTKTGSATVYKGETSLKFWNTKECNRMEGSDATIFPASQMSQNAKFWAYNRDMCRKFPMTFQRESYSEDGIFSYRFNFSKEVFQYPEESCYCHEGGNCPPSGVFNASACTFGAPVFFSFPHFLKGDPELFEDIEGLTPDEELHASYIDIHPKLGVPLSGKSRFQINVMLQTPLGITQLFGYPDGVILPVAWLELSLDTLSPDLATHVNKITLAVQAAYVFLSYGLIVISVISLTLLLRCYIYKKTKYQSNWSFKKNLPAEIQIEKL